MKEVKFNGTKQLRYKIHDKGPDLVSHSSRPCRRLVHVADGTADIDVADASTDASAGCRH